MKTEVILSSAEVEAKINEICEKEQKTVLGQEYLEMAFFLVWAAFAVIFFINVKAANVVALFSQFCVYAVILVAGYFWHRHLERHLKLLWEQKKSIIISQP